MIFSITSKENVVNHNAAQPRVKPTSLSLGEPAARFAKGRFGLQFFRS